MKSSQGERKILKKPRGVSCTKEYIHLIRSGVKTIEGRCAVPLYMKIKAGDMVRFFYRSNASDDVICEVIRVSKYQTFKDMLIAEGVNNCVPTATSLERALEVYHSFPKFREKELEYGVLALQLKLEDNNIY